MRTFFLFLLTLISCVANAATPSPVSEYRLPNGLKVLIKEDHRVPVVMTQVWYKVGSSYEPNGITGISHMLEHMMFKGTPKFGPGALSKIIANNGGEENAFTSSDFTAYYQMMTANKLPITLELEADRMRHLSLRQEDFIKEVEVVKEERRLRTDDNPQSLTYERFSAAANVASPYHHPVIGWMWDLENFKIDDVRKWYSTWYAPNNAVLVIVGDVKPAETYQLVQKYFGDLKPSKLPEVKQPGEVKDYGGRRLVVKAPAKLPLVLIGYNVPALKTVNKKSDAFALEVIAGILAGGDSARLPKEMVRAKQSVTQVDANYDIFSRLDNVFTFTAIPAQGHTPLEVENQILNEVRRLQTTPVDAHELARVKAQVIAEHTYQKDSLMNQASELGSLEAVNLPWREADAYVQHINEVTAADVQAAAKKYFLLDRITIATLKPLPIKSNQDEQPLVNVEGRHVR